MAATPAPDAEKSAEEDHAPRGVSSPFFSALAAALDRAQFLLQFLDAPGQRFALGGERRELLLAERVLLVLLHDTALELRLARVDVAQLRFESRDVLLRWDVRAEEHIQDETEQQHARRDERPRCSKVRSIRHDAGFYQIWYDWLTLELRSFFERAIRASFHDLAIRDDATAGYLADLLTRFARTENLHPRGASVPRLETVVDMLLDAQAAWREDSPWFRPEYEVTVCRHIGDYTLFMTGLFPERVERVASTGFYISQGKRAYQFVSQHDRASARSAGHIFRRLADRFESYARTLDYARRVYFTEHPGEPFFRLGFG